uniref:Uncharacterized protein n=1 Tax=Romanomermis culicivorax TaxID=13658 RepID=A0A915J3Y4_ROMCU
MVAEHARRASPKSLLGEDRREACSPGTLEAEQNPKVKKQRSMTRHSAVPRGEFYKKPRALAAYHFASSENFYDSIYYDRYLHMAGLRPSQQLVLAIDDPIHKGAG